jgi:two-component system, CAI-1 autoinducer sensor kinase/phosphatase CqsS
MPFMLQAVTKAFQAPLEPILHASPLRLKSLGIFVFLGQPFFGWMWLHVFPQPYENMYLRIIAACLGLLLVWGHFSNHPNSTGTEWVFALVMWLELPVLFMTLYFMNTTSIAWFGSVLVMLVVYYQLTDWRLATLGIVAAALISYATASVFFAPVSVSIEILSAQGAVLLFAWSSALELAISSANLRRKRLENSLDTMGIIAHELRTPLATLSLLGDALRGAAGNKTAPIDHHLVDSIVTRIYALSRAMNRQIDMQIANSSQLHLPSTSEEVSAGTMVQSAMTQYPFKFLYEKDVLEISLLSEFSFLGSHHLFEQVILNLVKNAYHALAVTQKPPGNGDVRIEVSSNARRGFIKVFDRGGGIDPAIGNKIFEPFFSTQSDTGHGLGLAFCKAVVHAAGGKISVSTTGEMGTCFTMALPICKPKRHWTGVQL